MSENNEAAVETAKGPGPGTDALVVAENVHKSFGRLQVLKGIDLEVRRR